MKNLKRLLSVILSFLIIIYILPMSVIVTNAETSGYYTYIVSNGEAKITACDTSISGDVVIPSTLGGYPVVAIYDKVFRGTSIENIVIPNTVTTLSNSSGNSNNFGAFNGNRSIKTVIFEEGTTFIPTRALRYCYSVERVVIPTTVTSIYSQAFEGCVNLKEIDIPEGVADISNSAFYDCTSLTSIVLPSTMRQIYNKAFYNCSNLKDIKLNSGLEAIYDRVFYGTAIETITIPKSVTTLSNSGGYAPDFGAFNGNRSIKTVIFEEGTTFIPTRALRYCYSVERVVIPTTVTSIYSQAFEECTSITIYGEKNSYAHTYALNNNIPFVGINFDIFNSSSVIIPVDPTPFDLREDGYCFSNIPTTFGYDENKENKIPYSTYCAVYPNYSSIRYMFEKKWSGNCFGMSATSILFNEGLLNKDDYGGKGLTINHLRSGQKNKDYITYYILYDDNPLKSLIEYYQVWQDTYSGQKALKDIVFGVSLNGSKVVNSVEYLLNNLDNYLVSAYLGNSFGHALVVNTAIEPENLGDGWYKIHLYDPNDPCTNGKFYRQTNRLYPSRYIEVNIYNNHYRLPLGQIKGDKDITIGYDEKDHYIIGSKIAFIRYEGFISNSVSLLSTDTYTTKTETQTEQFVKLSAKDISVYDSEDNLLFDVEDNLITYIDDSIEFEYPAGYTVDSEYNFTGNLILPIGEYKYDFGAEGIIQVDNGESFTAFKGGEGTDTTVKTDGTVILGGDKGSEIEVLVQNNYENDYTAVNTTISNNGTDDTVITLNSDNTLDFESPEETFDIKVETSRLKNAYLLSDTTTLETSETPVTELIEEKGEKIPNSLELVDVDYDSHIEYDGETHDNSPVVTFLGEELEEGVDYEVSGETVASESGKYSFKITGIGDFEGELEKSFNLLPKIDSPKSKLSLDENFKIKYSVDKSVFESGIYSNLKIKVGTPDKTVELTKYIENENEYIFTFDDFDSYGLTEKFTVALCGEFDEYIYSSDITQFSGYSLARTTCDANGDKIVDLKDLVRLKKHFAEDAEINGADPDSSGVIDSLDLAFLRKFMLFS